MDVEPEVTGPQLAVPLGGDVVGGRRVRTARGTIINGSFLVAGIGLGLIQTTVIARVLPTAVFGRFELLASAYITILTLGAVGVDDKYIQQNDPDQQRAFEIAFTLQWVVAAALAILLLVGIPLFALIYGQPSIIAPGLFLIAGLPALALSMPLWAHYRRMDFMRQRKLQMLSSLVGFAAIIVLLAIGLQLWALVLGGVIAAWVTAFFIVRSSPYELRFRWERGAAREYTRFSWPLFVATINTIILWQIPVTIGVREFGASAVAGIALSITITQFTTQVDSIVTATLYPAVCAVKDRTALLFEAFWKSNRLALLWAAPLGVAAVLFFGDFVHFVIGEKWRFAVPLIAITGASAAVNQIGFNWSAFYKAVGDTRPMARASVISLVAMVAIGVPLLVTHGLLGFGIGMAIVTVISVGIRIRYLMRLFPGLPMVVHIVRGVGPALTAAAAVVLLRVTAAGSRTLGRVIVEAALFAGVALIVTYTSERELLRECVNYLRRPRDDSAAVAPLVTATPGQ